MEQQLFNWSGWDDDYPCMTFYDTELVVQVGKFPPGTKFDSAAIDFDKGLLKFYNSNGEVVASYKLALSVAATIHE